MFKQTIEQRDLINRLYVGRKCEAFDYELFDNKGEKLLTARYAVGSEDNEWTIQIVFTRTQYADSQVYSFSYVMPKSKLPLELIAATGLRYFEMYLKEEIQRKIGIDFALGEKLLVKSAYDDDETIW